MKPIKLASQVTSTLVLASMALTLKFARETWRSDGSRATWRSEMLVRAGRQRPFSLMCSEAMAMLQLRVFEDPRAAWTDTHTRTWPVCAAETLIRALEIRDTTSDVSHTWCGVRCAAAVGDCMR